MKIVPLDVEPQSAPPGSDFTRALMCTASRLARIDGMKEIICSRSWGKEKYHFEFYVVKLLKLESKERNICSFTTAANLVIINARVLNPQNDDPANITAQTPLLLSREVADHGVSHNDT